MHILPWGLLGIYFCVGHLASSVHYVIFLISNKYKLIFIRIENISVENLFVCLTKIKWLYYETDKHFRRSRVLNTNLLICPFHFVTKYYHICNFIICILYFLTRVFKEHFLIQLYNCIHCKCLQTNDRQTNV